MNVLPVCMYMLRVCAWSPRKVGEGFTLPGTRVTDTWKLPCGCGEIEPRSSARHSGPHPP